MSTKIKLNGIDVVKIELKKEPKDLIIEGMAQFFSGLTRGKNIKKKMKEMFKEYPVKQKTIIDFFSY